MTLSEIIQNLECFSDEGTVFAEKIDGAFGPESRAVVIEMTDEELNRPAVEIAQKRAPGTSYFLEVFIAREVIEGWQSNHSGKEPTTAQALESIIFYATHDAYPESFFG